jgi:hypothetical protein
LSITKDFSLNIILVQKSNINVSLWQKMEHLFLKYHVLNSMVRWFWNFRKNPSIDMLWKSFL